MYLLILMFYRFWYMWYNDVTETFFDVGKRKNSVQSFFKSHPTPKFCFFERVNAIGNIQWWLRGSLTGDQGHSEIQSQRHRRFFLFLLLPILLLTLIFLLSCVKYWVRIGVYGLRRFHHPLIWPSMKVGIPENSSACVGSRIGDRRTEIQLKIMLICFPLTLPLIHLSPDRIFGQEGFQTFLISLSIFTSPELTLHSNIWPGQLWHLAAVWILL